MPAPLTPGPRLALLGAFDRFNFGDLLFPLIAEREIASHSPGRAVDVHAMVRSDLSRYGALPTRSMRDLVSGGTLKPGDVVVMAGGGMVGVDWRFLLSNLLGPAANGLLDLLPRLIGWTATENAARRLLGGSSPFPFVAAPEDFGVAVRVAYNAVGGSDLALRRPEVQAGTFERLAKASYVSVRDAETRRIFAPVESCVEVHLSPDSAMLMSEYYPRDRLRAQVSPSMLRVIDESPYVCFHANMGYLERHADQVVQAIEAVHEEFGLGCVLLPIGRYVGLDDHIGLAKLRDRLRTPVRMASADANLSEIMLTIASSRVFVGTSLHGAITSTAFAVPHLGLSERRAKVDHYLETWDLPEQAACVPLRNLVAQMRRVLDVPEDARERKRAELVELVQQNFARLARACDIPWV